MSDRRKFTPEFKADAVALVLSSGRPVAQIAPETGVVEGTLGNWVRTWREEHPEAGGKDEPGPVEWGKYKALQLEVAELKRQNEFLGKSQRLLCREATVTDVFTFIASEKANFPITWMCDQLGVARASFYRWLRPEKVTPMHRRRQSLTNQVRRVYDREKGMAGRDQIALILRNEGIAVAAGTVGAIMRQLGVRAVRMRAWKKTTDPDKAARTAHIRNHMLDEHGVRDFSSPIPGKRLVGDITYLRTGSGWLYLATVIDLCTREVIGWAMASHMRTELIIDALAMARDHGRLAVGGVQFHSDRGSQYTSDDFQRWCAANTITQSMGAVGVCWDNAVAESFFSHLKTEMFHHHSFENHLAARTAVMEYIEVWYNRRRPHRYNGGIPPAAARAAHQARVHELVAA
ncbi:MAG: IS3 family transposase [Rhodoglobus sp.]